MMSEMAIATLLTMCDNLNRKSKKLTLNECVLLSSLLLNYRSSPLSMSAFKTVSNLHGYRGTQQGFNKTLNKLKVKLGWIDIFIDKKDRRHRLIELTEKGKQIKEELVGVYNSFALEKEEKYE
jgi:DNA-binding MarR family transcriptional regulator